MDHDGLAGTHHTLGEACHTAPPQLMICRLPAKPRVRKILVLDINSAVGNIFNAMVSASRPMLSDPCKLYRLQPVVKINLEALCMPSIVNRYSDRLSRTWKWPVPNVFDRFPIQETHPEWSTELRIELKKSCNYGRLHLWNPSAESATCRAQDATGISNVNCDISVIPEKRLVRLDIKVVRCSHYDQLKDQLIPVNTCATAEAGGDAD